MVFMNRNNSLRKKLTIIFVVSIFLICIGITFIVATVFNNFYNMKSAQFINDISKQVTINVKNSINIFEDATFELLSNTKIQESLKAINSKNISDLDKVYAERNIFNEIGKKFMFYDNFESISIFTLEGEGTTYTTNYSAKDGVCQIFEVDDIIDAKGSTLWGLTDDGKNNICVARSIIDMDTQKPIGYINMIIEGDYIGDVISDNISSYPSDLFIINEENKIMSSSNEENIGKTLEIYDNQDINIENERDFNSRNYLYTVNKLQNNWDLVIIVPKDAVNKELSIFYIPIIILSIGLCCVIAIIVIRETGNVVRPLENLKDSMKNVGAGDFKARSEIVSNDEIGELSKAFNTMAEDIENLIDNAYTMEILQKQTEIEFLKMQINPHFLYNTLDTISWMAKLQKNMDISEVATALGELLRANLKQESMITIDDELRNVRNYIFIQEYRFGDKIDFEYEIDNSIRNYLVPNFILQPLIENSIIHGLEPKIEKGTLNIQIFVYDEKVYFRVVDNGVGTEIKNVVKIENSFKNGDSKSCIGLSNVYRRLKLYYGKDSSLRFTSEIDEGSITCFTIPLSKLKKKF